MRQEASNDIRMFLKGDVKHVLSSGRLLSGAEC